MFLSTAKTALASAIGGSSLGLKAPSAEAQVAKAPEVKAGPPNLEAGPPNVSGCPTRTRRSKASSGERPRIPT